MNNVLAAAYLKELESEYKSTRKCIERIPENIWSFKPHPKSMELGYLTQLVAAIPLWVTTMIDKGEIDFVTFPRPDIKTSPELIDYYETNFASAKKTLQNATDEKLKEQLSLKANGETMYTGTKEENIMNTLNHWVHHRGQLTVYMRLNDIEVPSIYGPSADDRSFR